NEVGLSPSLLLLCLVGTLHSEKILQFFFTKTRRNLIRRGKAHLGLRRLAVTAQGEVLVGLGTTLKIVIPRRVHLKENKSEDFQQETARFPETGDFDQNSGFPMFLA
ncbi:hypothetical protein ACJX0J_018634, partial [Zea mays]